MAVKTIQKNNKRWILGLIIVLLLVGIFAFKDIERRNRISTTQKNKQVEYSGVDGKTVFEILKNSHDVEYSNSDLGIFVISIDNLKATDHDYWLYYIDGKMGEKAADKMTTQNNQKIVWKYETLQ